MCFIDDDDNLLDAICTTFHDHIKVIPFISPLKAIEHLKDYKPHSFTELCIESVDRRKMEERDLHIETGNIHKMLFNPNRFDEISTLLVDFVMPQMTGTDFFKQVQHLKAKKVMLTGEASNEEGLRAFNDGLIDRFYQKGEKNLQHQLIGNMQKMQIAYFQSLSNVIIHSLENADAPPPHCVMDGGMVDPFFKILNEKRIAEYYLISNEGYFLTVGYEGELEWLIMHSEDELDTLHELISHIHDDTPSKVTEELLGDLKNCSKTLFFAKDTDSNMDPAEWTDEFILPTTKISTGKSDYYYAFAPFNAEKFPLEDFTPFEVYED